jgi:hypothetical protein
MKKSIITFIILFYCTFALQAEEASYFYQHLGFTYSPLVDASLNTTDTDNTTMVVNSDESTSEMAYNKLGLSADDYIYSSKGSDSYVITLDYSIGQKYITFTETTDYDTSALGIGCKGKYYNTEIFKSFGFIPYVDVSFYWFDIGFGVLIPYKTTTAKKAEYYQIDEDSYSKRLVNAEIESNGWFFNMRICDRLRAFGLENVQFTLNFDFSSIEVKNSNQSIVVSEIGIGFNYLFFDFSDHNEKSSKETPRYL